jgi:hypothetical protein
MVGRSNPAHALRGAGNRVKRLVFVALLAAAPGSAAALDGAEIFVISAIG